MGWPTKGSGKSYNSHTGFGHMVTCYLKKVVYSKILCRLCRICEVAAKEGMKAKEHNCIKNWTDTSKRMESAAILQMLTSCQDQRKFVTQWIISDDDSTMRAQMIRKQKVIFQSTFCSQFLRLIPVIAWR